MQILHTLISEQGGKEIDEIAVLKTNL